MWSHCRKDTAFTHLAEEVADSPQILQLMLFSPLLQLLFFPVLHITFLKHMMNGMLCSWIITHLKWLTWLSHTKLTAWVAALWQGEWLLYSQNTGCPRGTANLMWLWWEFARCFKEEWHPGLRLLWRTTSLHLIIAEVDYEHFIHGSSSSSCPNEGLSELKNKEGDWFTLLSSTAHYLKAFFKL